MGLWDSDIRRHSRRAEQDGFAYLYPEGKRSGRQRQRSGGQASHQCQRCAGTSGPISKTPQRSAARTMRRSRSCCSVSPLRTTIPQRWTSWNFVPFFRTSIRAVRHIVLGESVFFDFDIIQLTFNRDGVYTVIPVVSSPMDIVNAITPPVQMRTRSRGGRSCLRCF